VKILVINSGSSSLKYRLVDVRDRTVPASGKIERIGERESLTRHRIYLPEKGTEEWTRRDPVPDHGAALKGIVQVLTERVFIDGRGGFQAIGHRVVHGGERFREPVLVTEDVIRGIKNLCDLAPLHNPANLLGIRTARSLWPDVPQVAVFDTAFHQTLPPHAFRYALPEDVYRAYGVRRYGFHGTSHRYVAREAASFLKVPPENLNLIVFHLGNGASASAVRAGECVDTSMGLSPLEGLIMGTRSGDLDPSVVFHLLRHAGMTPDRIEEMLNHESGLKGLCGVNDIREVHRMARQGSLDAERALDMYAYRIRKYIGAYAAVLGRLDAVVFTAGIGENDPEIRERVCRDLLILGIELDEERNRRPGTLPTSVQSENSRVAVLVVPTNEELEIAEQTQACILKSAP